MITMQLDLTHATAQEKEAFLALPHVAGAIDSLTHVERSDVEMVLIVNDNDKVSTTAESYFSPVVPTR